MNNREGDNATLWKSMFILIIILRVESTRNITNVYIPEKNEVLIVEMVSCYKFN